MYIGIFENVGVVVHEQDAFDYAKSHLDDLNEKDKLDFVEWFFSGNFVRREENAETVQ